MGVPSFFRWIVQRYFNVIDNVIEAFPDTYDANIDGGACPLGFAIDNLYFDTNGLIHPCFHPEGRPQPKSEADVFEDIFQVLDRVVSVCRPRRLLYLAVDGPAPRAKLNQQRSRRFLAAYERQLRERLNQKDGAQAQAQAHAAIDHDAEEPEIKKLTRPETIALDEASKEQLDSNAITPGTPFMTRLSIALKYYVVNRQANSRLWQNLTVIYADAWSPGEGEHKVMSFIRIQRSQPNYDHHTVHCIYGLDADLIMLALGTHEPNFLILRDVVDTPSIKNTCVRCGHLKTTTTRVFQTVDPFVVRHEDSDNVTCPFYPGVSLRPVAFRSPLQFLHVSRLREYLQREFEVTGSTFERCIDDFVLLTFLVGNDFLPHIQCLDIREDAVIRMIYFYNYLKKSRKIGFLTTGLSVNMPDFSIFLAALAEQEARIFKARASNRKPAAIEHRPAGASNAQETPGEKAVREFFSSVRKEDKKMLTDSLNDYYKLHTQSVPPTTLAVKYISVNYELEKPGYSQRYYIGISLMDDFDESQYETEKFKKELKERVQKMCYHYLDGLIWVFRYYYMPKVEDWGWYYPYHYAPLLMDLANAAKTYTQVWQRREPSNTPFTPYEQLLAVMPPASSSLLPPCMQSLMMDPDSPLNKFYPSFVKCDLSEQTAAWKGVMLLPFITTKELSTAARTKYDQLTPVERQRNMFSDAVILAHKNHPSFALFKAILDNTPIPESFASFVVIDKVEKCGDKERKRFSVTKAVTQLNLLAGYYSVSRTDFFSYGSNLTHVFIGSKSYIHPLENCIDLEEGSTAAVLNSETDLRSVELVYNLENISVITNYTIALRFVSPRVPKDWVNSFCHKDSLVLSRVVTDAMWHSGRYSREKQHLRLIGMDAAQDQASNVKTENQEQKVSGSQHASDFVSRARAMGF